jgi:hypothetical protein
MPPCKIVVLTPVWPMNQRQRSFAALLPASQAPHCAIGANQISIEPAEPGCPTPRAFLLRRLSNAGPWCAWIAS